MENVQYIYKYFEGPRMLPTLHYLLAAQGGNNDVNICTFQKDMNDKEQLKKTKEFRKMVNRNDSNKIFNYQFWLINDEEIAKKMGIKTDVENVGDLYVVRKESLYTRGEKPNVKLNCYDYISEMVVSAEKLKQGPEAA